ncbi:MAG TPA: BTAD domain-containing putative transcriptional regulator [Methanocorpusculum sp.]|nr:BTAD domain-containing putative transcriptional regulator [Methanocorpusculum sp.]
MTDLLAQARDKTRLHQYGEAEALYTQYLENPAASEIISSEAAAVRDLLGFVQMKQKKYYEAIETFSECCEADEENAEYFAHLAEALKAVHRFEDAMAMYQRAAQISGSFLHQLKAGEMNLSLGNHDAALALFLLIQSVHQSEPEVYAYLAKALSAKGMELDAALSKGKELELRKALTETAPSGETWAAYAHLQLSLKNYAEAKRGYRESLQFADSANVRLGLGEALVHLKDEAADREFEAAAAIDPLDFAMLVTIGDTLTRLGKYALAIQMYAQALALHNVNADTWVAIAYALYKSGNSEDAQAFYEMAKASAAVREMPWADKMHKSEKTEELDKVF